MKTTIEISDPLFQRARRLASRRKTTLRAVVESALRHELSQAEKGTKSFRLRRHSFRGKGLAPGLSQGDWGEIRRLAYERHGG